MESKTAAIVLSAFVSVGGATEMLGESVECNTVTRAETQYTLKIENAEVPVAQPTGARLIKYFYGKRSGSLAVVMKKAPTPKPETVFVSERVSVRYSPQSDDAGVVNALVFLGNDDKGIRATCDNVASVPVGFHGLN